MTSTDVKTGEKAMQLTFGCSRLGKAAFEDTTSKALVVLEKAWDLGIRSFDTASNYTYGDSEKILGNFKKGKEEEIKIFTKGGSMLTKSASYLQILRPIYSMLRPILKKNKGIKRMSPKRKNFEIDYLREMIAQSVKRMGDKIDVFQIHNPTEAVLKNRTYVDLFKEFKTKYKVSKCGLALTHFEDIATCTYVNDLDIIQFPLSYYNFKPEYEKKLNDLRDKGVTLIGRMPFHRGLLTDRNEIYTGGNIGITDSNARDTKKAICEKYKISEVELALWFLKDMGLLDYVLFSSFNLAHLEENVKVFNADISSHFSWRNIVKDLES